MGALHFHVRRRSLYIWRICIHPLVDRISPVDYLAERNARQEELFPEARPLPGVMRLVRHLKRHGVPMAVATSSHSRAFKIKAQNNRELFDLFDLVVTGDDAAVGRLLASVGAVRVADVVLMILLLLTFCHSKLPHAWCIATVDAHALI